MTTSRERAAQIKATRSLDVAYVYAQDTLAAIREVLAEYGDKLPVYTVTKLNQILAEHNEETT